MTVTTRRTGQEQRRADRSPAITPERRADSSDHRATAWTWVRLGAGVLVLLVLVWRIGTGPFLDGLAMTSPGPLVVATAITALTTLCCAWRWQLVAGRLGVGIRLGPAVAAVYRAQFLNATLPGGVLGDVDRAVAQGRDSGGLGPAIRSVFWERALGQAVQVGLTVALVLLVPSPLRPLGAGAAAAGLAVVLLSMPARRHARLRRVVERDLRAILRPGRVAAAIVLASGLAVTGHLAVFLLAMHVAGVEAPAQVLVPVAAVVLLASGLPLNLAGWGPREGAAAWVFGAVGLGVAAGVTTAVVYGVMALVATAPGAVHLLVRRQRVDPQRTSPTAQPVLEGAGRG